MTHRDFTLLGISIHVRMDNSLSVESLFPSLQALAWDAVSHTRWQIEVSPGSRLPGAARSPPATATRTRIWPDVDLLWWESAGLCHFAVDGATATLNPRMREAHLMIEPRAIRPAEKLGRVLVMEMLRSEGLFTFHAGAVEAGGAVLICGPSGSGKTTLAAAWPSLGNARFMAEDRCVVFRKNGQLWAGGIADEIGLRPGTASLLQRLGVRVPATPFHPDGKRYYNAHDLLLSFCTDPYPVRAILLLNDSPAREPVWRASAGEVFQRLRQENLFHAPMRTMRGHFEIAMDISIQVPAYFVQSRANCRQMTPKLDRLLSGLPVPAQPLFPPPLRHSRRMPGLAGFPAIRHLKHLIANSDGAARAADWHDVEWMEIVRAADSCGLLTLLAATATRTDSFRRCSAPLRNILRVEKCRAIAARKRHIQELGRLAPVLESTGVPWAIVNGPAIAERSYAPAWSRRYEHLEILVPPAAEACATQALASLDYVPTADAPPPASRAATTPACAFLNPGLQHVAWLHTACPVGLPARRLPTRHAEDLVQRAEVVRVKGISFRALNRADQLLWTALVFDSSPISDARNPADLVHMLQGDAPSKRYRLPEPFKSWRVATRIARELNKWQ